MKRNRKKTKKRLKFKSVMTLFLLIVLIGGVVYYIKNIPIRNIYIIGNNEVSDYEILKIANLKDYPKMFKYSSSNLEKKIYQIPKINEVKVKKSLSGKLVINIEEARVLFYNRNDKVYVLSNHKTLNETKENAPFLINYVPNTIYDRLIDSLAVISDNTLSLISEIEYSPSKSGEVIIDDTRFLLRMNDGNNVYINLINIERLNMYLEISTIFETNGTLELDSANPKAVFK